MKPDKSATKGERILAIGAVCVLLASVGFIGRSLLVQRQRTQQAFITSQERTVADVAKANKAAQSTSDQESAKLEKANLLRAKWSKWALEHKDLLRDMMHAQPNDNATFDRVWKALPRPEAKDNVFVATDLLPKGDISTDVDFGWAPSKAPTNAQLQQISDPQQRAIMSAGEKQIVEVRHDEFVKFRDVALSTSLAGGNTTVTLWASGRITKRKPQTQEERTQLLASAKSDGKTPRHIDFQGKQQEVAPPYDFLR